jgi:hypothetical protein
MCVAWRVSKLEYRGVSFYNIWSLSNLHGEIFEKCFSDCFTKNIKNAYVLFGNIVVTRALWLTDFIRIRDPGFAIYSFHIPYPSYPSSALASLY